MPTLESVADTKLRSIHAEPSIPAAATVARVLVNSSNVVTFDGDDLTIIATAIAASPAALAILSNALSGADT